MDRQGPPNRPRYQLTRGLNLFRQRKRWTDVTLSGQEASMMRHLANAHYWPVLPVLYTGRLFLAFGGTGHADRQSNCPLDRVLTYKNLIYLLNLQIFVVRETSLKHDRWPHFGRAKVKGHTMMHTYTPYPMSIPSISLLCPNKILKVMVTMTRSNQDHTMVFAHLQPLGNDLN